MASVVFVPHAGGCEGCTRYLDELGAAVEGLREWATRAVVLVAARAAGAGSATPAGPAGVSMLADDRDAERTRLGVGADQAAVIQADRWGAVYLVEAVGRGAGDHALLPAGRDLTALAQFIDIQCPECGVPSKEWMAVSPFPLG